MQELFDATQMEKVLIKQVNYSSSCIAYNNGNGNFTIQAFPLSIQLSSVKTLLLVDVNNDGNVDLVMGGNEFGFQPQLGRLDASHGDVLLNDGEGNFSILNQTASGINLQGQVRDICLIKSKAAINVLFLQNNEYPVLYKLKKLKNTN